MKLTKTLWWAYFVELLLSSLIVLLVVIIFGKDAVSHFARDIGLNIVTALGIAVFSAAFGMILLVFQRLESPFYQWLAKRGKLNTYIKSFKYVAFICVLSVILVVLINQIPSNKSLAIITLYVLVLLGINAITFLNNVTALMLLEIEFRKKLNRENKD